MFKGKFWEPLSGADDKSQLTIREENATVAAANQDSGVTKSSGGLAGKVEGAQGEMKLT